MAINRELFIDKYLEELKENIQLIEQVIVTLRKDPENEDELNIMLRALHTIKGSSRMLKFSNIEKIAHGLENVFKGVTDKRYGITKKVVQLVFLTTDYFKTGVAEIKKTSEDDFQSGSLLKTFEKAYANAPYSLEEVQQEKSELTATEKSEEGQDAAPVVPAGVQESFAVPSQYDSIRIKTDKIENLVKLVNNLIIKQFQSKKDYEQICGLEDKFLNLRSYNSNTHAIGIEKSSELKKMNNEFLKEIQKIKKNLSGRMVSIEENTFELQEEIFSLRMLPLNIILGPLGKMIEEIAINREKEINFTTRGTDLKLDKVILENINDPIIHIVRNAVDHAIESPEQRQTKGKEPAGNISIHCYSESSRLIIKIEDDGRGMDYDRIRQRIVEIDPMQEAGIDTMPESELISYLFRPGFSTKEEVSDLSGRGVGLDIVRSNIEKVKGKIAVISETDKGTVFTLSLPLSLATVEGFYIRACGQKLFMPADYVSEILIYREQEIISLLNTSGIKWRSKVIPLYDFSSILNLDIGGSYEHNQIVIVESLEETIGIIVEKITAYSSLIYKSPPKNLQKLSLIQGIVFDESFNIINMLYVPGIIRRFKDLRNIDLKSRFIKDKRENKQILLVDDSLNTREIEKSILEMENYNVTTATDGIDGLDKLHIKNFNLIITDIDMPRMDGFTFIENIKNDDRHRETPIIIVSSHRNEEYKRRSLSLNVHSYIVKSDFDRNDFISEVNKLIG